MKYDFVIIGGGISGLYILDNLQRKYPHLKGILLERSSIMGGHIRTEYNKNHNVVLEKGPWRVHHTHHKLIKLVKQLQLNLLPVSSSKPESTKLTFDICKKTKSKTKKTQKVKSKKLPNGGISYRDNIIQQQGICNYQQAASFSRLPLIMDVTSKPYDVNLQYTGQYYVVKEGLHQIIQNMVEKNSDKIYSNSMVTDVKKIPQGYKIIYQSRNKNIYRNKVIYSKHLFLCLPPHYTKDWDVVKDNLLPLIHSVDSVPLHHIYGYCSNLNKFHNNSFYFTANSELSSIISGDFSNNWFQVSYSGGENARYWNRLKLNHPRKFKETLIDGLRKLNIRVKIDKVKSFYWEKAVHYWKPIYGFNLKRCVENSIYPHPINLPNLYWACEAFSDIQGWIEGALSNCDKVIHKFIKHQEKGVIYKSLTEKTDDYVLIDNRYIDVSKWKYVHPGSYNAIQFHLKEDISKLFRQIKHSEYSWAILYNLQKGWVDNGKNRFVTMG